MGYTRSLGVINRNFEIFKQILKEPEIDHTFEVTDWQTAQRLAYHLREGMYAAQFHSGYDHIARLRDTHTVGVELNTVRVRPRYNPEMIRKIQPIPPWAKYGNRKSTIKCEEAKSLIEIVSTLRDLNTDSPWDEIVYPNFRFDRITPNQRSMLFQMTNAIEYRLLDLEESGLTVVRELRDSSFSALYYDLDSEDDYKLKLDTE